MTVAIGWLLIVTLFGLGGLVLLWPGYRLARRRLPQRRGLGWWYLGAAAVCGLALWFLVPVVVHGLFARSPY